MVLLASGAYAQRGWQVGVFALPQYTAMFNGTDFGSSDTLYGYRPTFGMGVGVIGGYGFTQKMGIRFNLIFSDQGQSNNFLALNNENILTEYQRDLRLRYLKLPVLFRYNTDPEKKVALTVETGPQLDILVNVNEQTSDKTFRPFPPVGQTYTGYPKRYETITPVNFGWVGAVGMDIKLRYNVKMGIQLRTDVAFVDAERKSAKFLITEAGDTREVKYYEQGIYDPALTGEKRGRSTNFTLGVAVGFTYLFIPRFHY